MFRKFRQLITLNGTRSIHEKSDSPITKMLYPIQAILKLAHKTYSNPNLVEHATKANHQLLISLMSNLKASDLNFNQSEVDQKILVEAPCAYTRLFENQFFNLCVFSIRPGSRLPLHNHPSMNGFLRVISGKIVIKNFDLLPANIEEPPKKIRTLLPFSFTKARLVPTRRLEDKVLSPDDQTVAVVEPMKGNIHEITVAPECKTGSAFLDLIAPPYDGSVPERSASYYKIIGESYSNRLSSNITWLMQISEPNDYWCEHVAYSGPELSDRILAGED